MITSSILQSICVTTAGRIACLRYLPFLIKHMPDYGIDTPARVAAFIAQIAHESSDFTRIEENLNYSAKGLADTWPSRFKLASGFPNPLASALAKQPEAIANHVYANRMGNGPVESGDGWRYRGRGLKQITGKDNYRQCGEALNLDLVTQPDLLLNHDSAVESACWFWRARNLSPLADAGNFLQVTKNINGGTIGHGRLDDDRPADRVDYYARLLSAMGINQ